MALEVKGVFVTDKTGTRTPGGGRRPVVEPGSVTAVIGANGAGKSELVLGLAGVLPVSAGTVLLDGRAARGAWARSDPPGRGRSRAGGPPRAHPAHRRRQPAGRRHLLTRQAAAAQLAKVYGIFPELAERKGQIAGTLSGGQQQMLALGHALMAAPSYLLIDEMSLGLAPLIVKRLLGVVTALKAEGAGILLIEQFTDLALGIADTAVVLRNGKMRYGGPARALVEDKGLLHSAYFGRVRMDFCRILSLRCLARLVPDTQCVRVRTVPASAYCASADWVSGTRRARHRAPARP